MQNIPALPLDSAAEGVAPLFAAIKGQMGGVPNIFRTMANSPVALEAFLGFNGGLGNGRLSAAQRESIALACAGSNGCDYCASAHSALGAMAGLSKEEMTANLRGTSDDAKNLALVTFVRAVVAKRGQLDAGELAAFQAAGFDAGETVEVLANIAVNIFTNYFNHIAGTEIDFNVVSTADLVAA